MSRLVALGFALLIALPAGAQTDRVSECRDGWGIDGSRGSACSVREIRLAPRGTVRLDAGANGGVRVEAWDRPDIALRVVVVASAPTDADAERLAASVAVDTSETIRPRVPTYGRGSGVQVSFRLSVPRATSLDLSARNGAISIDGVSGTITFETRNGAVRLAGLSGDVRGRTRNGALRIDLAGPAWDGAGLDVETANGGVRLTVPDGYSADLEAGTAYGRLRLGFPVALEGDVSRRVRATLGQGGPPVRVTTRNGSFSLDRTDA